MQESLKFYGTIFELIVRKDFSMDKKIKNGVFQNSQKNRKLRF
jgi:hypothetical protein